MRWWKKHKAEADLPYVPLTEVRTELRAKRVKALLDHPKWMPTQSIVFDETQTFWIASIGSYTFQLGGIFECWPYAGIWGQIRQGKKHPLPVFIQCYKRKCDYIAGYKRSLVSGTKKFDIGIKEGKGPDVFDVLFEVPQMFVQWAKDRVDKLPETHDDYTTRWLEKAFIKTRN